MMKQFSGTNHGIVAIALLSLTLFFGFISSGSPNRQERQASRTEWVSRCSVSPKRTITYRIPKVFQLLYFISRHEIVKRLKLIDHKISIALFENLKLEKLTPRLKIERLAFTLRNSKLSDTYI